MSRGAAARWEKLGNYDYGWGICAGKIRAQPLFTEKSFFDIHRASAKNVRALALALLIRYGRKKILIKISS